MIKLKNSKAKAVARVEQSQTLVTGLPSPAKPTPGSEGAKVLTADELKASFETWMKIAADNKINASNTWNLALIDYFHDMTLLKEGDSINFQKASCTLDGCVKIYTSRVDSVDSETKKLLSGLVDNSVQDDEPSQNQDDSEKRKVKKRVANTLEKDFTNLNVKKFDLEFTVDPLFRKTAAEFDEGGARGLLLNHLCLGENGQIIFDASDALPKTLDLVDNHEPVNLSRITDLLGDKLNMVWSQFVCPSFRNFSFDPLKQSEDAFVFEEPEEVQDYNDYNDYFDAGDPMDDDNFDVEEHGFRNFPDPFATAGMAGLPEPELGFEANENGDTLTALDSEKGEVGEAIFSYFDTANMKNWAGPEFWKSRALKLHPQVVKDPAAKKRTVKAAFVLDFLEGEAPEKSSLFAKTSTTITLPKTVKVKNDYLLPEDIHVSSADFLSLLLQPSYKIQMTRGKRVVAVNEPDQVVLDQVQEWQGQAFDGQDDPYDQDQGFDVGPNYSDDEDVEPLEEPSFNPSMFGVTELSDFTGVTVKERPKGEPMLTFAKKAKRVDVTKLKENLWHNLVDHEEECDSADIKVETVEGEKTFTDIVHGLDDMYPEKKRQDISVAFCFICVLHLANEMNLSIEGSNSLDQLVISQN